MSEELKEFSMAPLIGYFSYRDEGFDWKGRCAGSEEGSGPDIPMGLSLQAARAEVSSPARVLLVREEQKSFKVGKNPSLHVCVRARVCTSISFFHFFPQKVNKKKTAL